jgi:hypothetical protein
MIQPDKIPTALPPTHLPDPAPTPLALF